MIKGIVTGEAEVLARLEGTAVGLRRELRVGIGRLSLKLQSRVKQDKLSGQVLGVRTGRGRRSIAQDVFDEGDKVAGVVSTAVPYMIGWELGWPGGSGVKSPKAGLKASKDGFGASGTSFKNGSPKQRSFLRSALKDLAASGDITTEIQKAVDRATA